MLITLTPVVSLVAVSLTPAAGRQLSPGATETIASGRVHVQENWLPPELVTAMRRDAEGLHASGMFSADGLTNNALKKEQQGFSANYDRQTFRNEGWGADTGDLSARLEFARRMQELKAELARGLNRPSLATQGNKLEAVWNHHEMTYNWYEPGASLGRHLDEHHEETKGPSGWTRPSRRSVTWLVYLNDDWKEEEGGALRCMPRIEPSVVPVGAHETNLQVGWLAGDCPVFLDSSTRPDGMSALYILGSVGAEKQYLSPDFYPTRPAAFDQLIQPQLRPHFQQISTARLDPRFASNAAGPTALSPAPPPLNEGTFDVLPRAGTLVLFDSVSLPHKVLRVDGQRRRIATTGWFHEDSQTFL